ncbi:heavy-metal-associated domain-containing protein [Flagellimonas pacifica]|uniref:Copper chaperone CopZ n=1 Tax=Flagellimonas pacifica TaxID=1247520 RepID=A0A285MU84_9FLAO|nr:heavy metal-associated domain-containing protein [Allomuricauda parva]SNZ00749.1 Copper chaperone CopZ [Allomuricauda parva]
MNTTVKIQNLKCGGCANTIKKKISALKSIEDVFVNVETDEVSFGYEGNEDFEAVKKELSKLGYPLMGKNNPRISQAKSYLSCAIGRMGKED